MPTRKGNEGAGEFASLLDQAAAAVVQGADPDDVAAQYGEAAGRLHPLLEVVAQLRVLREPPPPASLAAARVRFLARAQELRSRRSARRSRSSTGVVAWSWPRLGGVALRPVVSLVLVAILFSLVGYTAQAAGASLPGSPLYPVKLVVEQTQVTLATDREARAHLQVTFAARRLDEIQRLAEAGRQPDPAALSRLAQQWEASVQAIASLPEGERTALLAQALEALSREREALRRLLGRCPPEVQEPLLATLAWTEETELRLRKSLTKPEDFREPAEPAAERPAVVLPSETPTPPAPTPTPEAQATPTPVPPQVRKARPRLSPPPATPTATQRPPRRARTATPTATPEPPTPTATPRPTPTPTPKPPTPTATPTAPPPEPTATPTGIRLDPTPTDTASPAPVTPALTPTPTPTATPTPGRTPRPFEPVPPTLTPPTKPPPTLLPPPPRPTSGPDKPAKPPPPWMTPEPAPLPGM